MTPLGKRLNAIIGHMSSYQPVHSIKESNQCNVLYFPKIVCLIINQCVYTIITRSEEIYFIPNDVFFPIQSLADGAL